MLKDLARELGTQAEAFCRTFYPNGRHAGGYWTIGNVHGDEGGSLAIRLHSNGKAAAGSWTDYATGEWGDLLNLIPHVTNASSWPDIIREAKRFLRKPEHASASPTRQIKQNAPTSLDQQQKATRLFTKGVNVAGTLAHRYLKNRDITRLDPALAFHPECYFQNEQRQLDKLPALLARITDNDGQITGVAKTWLDPERGCKADIAEPKRVAGRLAGNAVRFGRAGRILGCGEGIETILSVGSALPKLPLAACLTASHLGLFDVPEQVETLWVFRDNDDAGAMGFERLSARIAEAGRNIAVLEVVPVLGDWNDDVCRWGVEAVKARLLEELDEAALYV